MSLTDRLVLKPDFKVRVASGSLRSAAEKIEAAFPGIEKRAPEDVPDILRKVGRAHTCGDWKGVSSGDVGIAVYEHVRGEIQMPQDLRLFLDQEMRATTNTTLMDAMCRGYLICWSRHEPKTRILSNLLIQKSSILPTRWRTLFAKCPEFLDFVDGAEKVALRMIDAPSPYQWLKASGLPAPHDVGFMREAHVEFLRHSPPPKSEKAVEKLLNWVTPSHQSMSFEPWVAQTVEKVLSPWISEDCPEGLREFNLKRLVDRFGDPRTDKPAFWSKVGQEYKRILLKWLARKSMEAIFEIVTRTEGGSEQGHQWSKRKRFWMGVYDQGRIDEAWVALGSKAVPHARDLYARTGDPSYISFGKQSTRNDTCLLLMRIGTKTIVEGSHSFRVHVFPTSTRTTPELYLGNYDLADILLPVGHHDARMHDTAGNWMGWVQRRVLR